LNTPLPHSSLVEKAQHLFHLCKLQGAILVANKKHHPSKNASIWVVQNHGFLQLFSLFL
jgi:hypothetical protein